MSNDDRSGTYLRRTLIIDVALIALLGLGCSNSDPGGGGSTGGVASPSGGSGGASVSGGASGVSGGKTSGGAGTAAGSGGMAATTGGVPPTATGGAPPISTGGATTTGGSSTGGKSSSTGGASGGASTGGTGGAASAGAGSGDTYVTGVKVAVHSKVATVLVVTWTQAVAAEQTWLEFGFESGSVMTSHAAPGAIGAHQDVVLGVPEKSAVTLRIVSKQGGVEHKTSDYKGTTGAIPAGMPEHQLISYDAALASKDRFMLGAVEDSIGGKAGECCYWSSTWWTYIMDRKGRIVWYYADPARNPTSSFPRKARDGDYLFMEKRPFSKKK